MRDGKISLWASTNGKMLKVLEAVQFEPWWARIPLARCYPHSLPASLILAFWCYSFLSEKTRKCCKTYLHTLSLVLLWVVPLEMMIDVADIVHLSSWKTLIYESPLMQIAEYIHVERIPFAMPSLIFYSKLSYPSRFLVYLPQDLFVLLLIRHKLSITLLIQSIFHIKMLAQASITTNELFV